MADAVVSFALNRLVDFLILEAVFIGSVKQEVEWLKDELKRMQCYIASAEEKHVDDPMVRKWLTDITEIAYDTEDVLDQFVLQVHDEDTDTDEDTKERNPGCFPSMSSCIKCCKKVNLREKVNLRNIRKDIEKLKNRINDLPRIRELYKLESSSNKGEGTSDSRRKLRQLRRTTSFFIEEKVVGHEDGTTRLLAKLLDSDPLRWVVSIYGMGGLGKTTLARKLYHHRDVKMKFQNCCGWVCVSQDYNTRDLLIRAITSFGFTTLNTEELQRMGEEDLERYLHESLKGRSYLLVIDDIWKTEAWESIKRAFPDGNNGSRVIITTRNKEVVDHLNERNCVHKLRFLTFDESWQLFCEKAFGNPNADHVDDELKTLGMEMVQKCEGLPLAVIVLGGLLSKKTKPREWTLVREHIWKDLKKVGSIHIPNLFALSFDDLPYQLKSCFLYMSLFPEDFEIDVKKLIRLWVAEGFVSSKEYQTMEDVANENFHDLINRSLIQIEKISWGRVITCQVHDLLRDLAIEKARELNFIYIYDQMKHSIGEYTAIISSCRRKSIYSGIENFVCLQQSNPSLRSLLFFNPYGSQEELARQLPNMCTEFRFLRVLNLDGYRGFFGKSLIEEIGKLILLKYLGLRNSYIVSIPRSILNLRRLQTLDLWNLELEVRLPEDISKLQELRHLLGRFNGPLQIDNLTKLQSLKYVSSAFWTRINTEKLINLRELWISESGPMKSGAEFHFDSIAKLVRLEQLVVNLYYECFASLQPLTRCSNLMDLRLFGKIEKLPKDIHQVLPKLECLLLKKSQLRDDPMPSLEKLGSLMILFLGVEFYSGKKLFCSAQGFRQLEILKLEGDGELEEWQLEEGAMPMLRGLSIPQNSKLRIPERLRQIPPPADCDFELDRESYMPF